jgi:phenylpropionate dioxygenase-like ring-hydroxylating dioxygenase large terminal subunit
MDETTTGNPVRTDFVPVDDYISKDFLRLENERVWPRVWLMACREEELGKPGSFMTFEIVRESILLVRQDSGAIKAFYNVCQHRGRRLKEGCGQSGRSIYCKFHGWSWNLDGSIQRVVHRAQWDGCPAFGDEDLHLPEVRVDTWGGWVFVTMNPEAPPLLDYLGDVPGHLDCYALDKMRMIWGVTMITPANWKLVLNAFNEAYHVEATHPQTLRHNSSILPSEARGIHAMFGPTLFDEVELPNRPAAIAALQRDPRDIILESFEEMQRDLQAMYLEPGVAAARRVHAEIAPGTDVRKIGLQLLEFHREELEKRGVEWPEGLTPEAMHRAGFGWHLFPNFIILPSIDGALCYRTRPHPDDPNECVWDIWSFGRFAPGAEPAPELTFVSDHREFLEKNRFLRDDLVNLPEVQKGMYSRGFRGLRTNPVQEQCVVNLHRTIHEFIRGGGG